MVRNSSVEFTVVVFTKEALFVVVELEDLEFEADLVLVCAEAEEVVSVAAGAGVEPPAC